MGKSVKSHKLGISIPKRDVEMQQVNLKSECRSISPTPADCIKYGLALDKARLMQPEDLTSDDYIALRKHGLTKQAVRRMYGFKNDCAFYNTLKKIGMHPEPTDDKATQEPAEPLPAVIETLETVVSPPENIHESGGGKTMFPLPPALAVITKHICPICYEEHNTVEVAETCLKGHPQIIDIEKIDGCSEIYNCPMLIYAKLSDNRVVMYGLIKEVMESE